MHSPVAKEVHILWITAGLSCDGDTVSVTAAEQPSIEDAYSADFLEFRRFIFIIPSSLLKLATTS